MIFKKKRSVSNKHYIAELEEGNHLVRTITKAEHDAKKEHGAWKRYIQLGTH